MNCSGVSRGGGQSAKQTSRKLEGGNPCQRESAPRGIQASSACGVRLFIENRPDRSSDSAVLCPHHGEVRRLPLHVSRMMHPSRGRSERSSTGKAPIKGQLERENKQLRITSELLKKASAYLPRRCSTARSAIARGLRSRAKPPRLADHPLFPKLDL